LIELPDTAVTMYLEASHLFAVYVARGPGAMLRTGASRDLADTYTWLRKENFELMWVAWCDTLKRAQWAAQAGADEPLIVSTTVKQVVDKITKATAAIEYPLYPHADVLMRARSLNERADEAMEFLQATKVLRDWNDAYRAHRLAEKAQGRVVPDWRIMRDRLKFLLVRLLIDNVGLKDAALVVRREFPWLAPVQKRDAQATG